MWQNLPNFFCLPENWFFQIDKNSNFIIFCISICFIQFMFVWILWEKLLLLVLMGRGWFCMWGVCLGIYDWFKVTVLGWMLDFSRGAGLSLWPLYFFSISWHSNKTTSQDFSIKYLSNLNYINLPYFYINFIAIK